MKFKDFVINAVAKDMQVKAVGSIDDNNINSLLLDFALKQFNAKSELDAEMLVTDSSERVDNLADLLKQASKQDKIELLMKIGSFIDHLSSQGRFFYFIPVDEIYISEKGTVLFNWFEFFNYCIQDQFMIPKNIQQKYGKLLDRNVSAGVVSYQMLNSNLSKNSFIKFMMQCLYPKVAPESMISITYWINVAITELGFTPEEKRFIVKLITDNNEFNNCQDIIEQYQTMLNKSIVDIPSSIKKLKWSYGFHTEQGRNKRSNQNEDAYEIIQTADEESILFMVADGVSTANIGRGKIISSRIQEYIADKENSIKDFMNNIAQLNHQDWVDKAKKEITSILVPLNNNLTEELNLRLKESPQTYPEHQPMSSTIILGMINNNRCVFGYLGDSHVFYSESNNMLRLTEDHNVLSERIIDYLNQDNKKPFTTTTSDKHLTKTFPVVRYDEDEENYLAIEVEDELTFFEFYPAANSEIIASTDGLLDSIGTTKNEIISEKELQQTMHKIKQNSKDAIALAREVGRNADNNSGIDNITLLIFTNQVKQTKNYLKNEPNTIVLN